jgi:hypothetical protein
LNFTHIIWKTIEKKTAGKKKSSGEYAMQPMVLMENTNLLEKEKQKLKGGCQTQN